MVVSVWFGYFAPRALEHGGGAKRMSLAFKWHLICACLTTLICVFSTLFTPSMGRKIAAIHKVIGRVAVVLSLVGTFLGYVAASVEIKDRSRRRRDHNVDSSWAETAATCPRTSRVVPRRQCDPVHRDSRRYFFGPGHTVLDFNTGRGMDG